MHGSTLFEKLCEEKVIAIVRGVSPESLDKTAEALVRGGIKLLEITMNTEGALRSIDRWRSQHGDHVHIGAGTVLDLQMAQDAVAAGAEFLISPNLNLQVIEFALSQGVDVWPGAMTPTEIVNAWQAGAQAVKLFPMGALGLAYLKEIRAPLGHIPIIATGGVNTDNIHAFLAAGAVAVGIGGNLVNRNLIAEGKFDEISRIASEYVRLAYTGGGTHHG